MDKGATLGQLQACNDKAQADIEEMKQDITKKEHELVCKGKMKVTENEMDIARKKKKFRPKTIPGHLRLPKMVLPRNKQDQTPPGASLSRSSL